MLTAISRYGARVLPKTEEIVAGCKARGEFIQGPQIAQFEEAFARRAGAPATPSPRRTAAWRSTTSSRRSTCPPGSEIVLPALTFWVVPELARVAGLKVVFADVDPTTFTMDPAALERGDHARHARRRADASLRAAVRHGRDHGDRDAPQPAR